MSIVPGLPVDDVSRTVEFYRNVLGFELVGATGKGGMTRARLRLGDSEILFRSARTDGIGRALKGYDVEDRLVLHIRVEDVASLYQRVKGSAPIIRELETTLFGLGEFAIEDVDGIILSFSQTHQAGPHRTAHLEQHEDSKEAPGAS
jgi:uncharacterized glyoxalase superfamily protein PhnB